MDATTTNERKKNSERRAKFFDILKKVFLWSGVVIGCAFILALLYQLLKFILVAAVFFIAFMFPGRRW